MSGWKESTIDGNINPQKFINSTGKGNTKTRTQIFIAALFVII